MSDRLAATRLIAARVLRDLLAEQDSQLRQDMQAGMVVGDRATAVVYENDEPVVVGHVQLTKGTSTTTAAVTDAEALLAWVKEHAPTEVQTVELVRPSFQKTLLDQVKSVGGWLDPATGELLDVEGVTVTPATPRPTLTVKPTDDAADVVRRAWADGRLSLTDLTALPAGQS